MRTRFLAACMAAGVVALGAGAASASADTNTFDMPFSGPVTNDCFTPGEVIAINGTTHIKQTDNATLDGIKSQIEMNTTGVTGTTVFPVAGVKYVMNDQTSDMLHADLDDAQMTMEQTMILTRQRETTTTLPTGGDDFRLHLLIHLTVVDGVAKADKFDLRSECQ
jgi:hypothetical protein